MSNVFVCLFVCLWGLPPLSTIFQLYRGDHFIGEENRRTRKKIPTCRNSPTNFNT